MEVTAAHAIGFLFTCLLVASVVMTAILVSRSTPSSDVHRLGSALDHQSIRNRLAVIHSQAPTLTWRPQSTAAGTDIRTLTGSAGDLATWLTANETNGYWQSTGSFTTPTTDGLITLPADGYYTFTLTCTWTPGVATPDSCNKGNQKGPQAGDYCNLGIFQGTEASTTALDGTKIVRTTVPSSCWTELTATNSFYFKATNGLPLILRVSGAATSPDTINVSAISITMTESCSTPVNT